MRDLGFIPTMISERAQQVLYPGHRTSQGLDNWCRRQRDVRLLLHMESPKAAFKATDRSAGALAATTLRTMSGNVNLQNFMLRVKKSLVVPL